MTADRPNRWPWPPMIFAAVLLTALVVEMLVPLAFAAPGWLQPLGLALVTAGVALIAWAGHTMAKAKTTILPHKGSERLVTSGPFAFSRNPIYLANGLILAGAGLGFGLPWLIVGAVIDPLLVWHFAIRREEAHLAHRFGVEWQAYKARVGRWLGPL